MIIHHLRVAFRNLKKYKLQTMVSVLSIAIGIVTLAFVHAALGRVSLPSICSQSYYDRAYKISFTQGNVYDSNQPQSVVIRPEIFKALTNGLTCTEQIAVPNGSILGGNLEWQLMDSTIVKIPMNHATIDPGYPAYLGIRSAITGEKIKRLKPGEAIISKQTASTIFGDANPVGAIQTGPSISCNGALITIVDVYEDLSLFDGPIDNAVLYYSLGEIGDLEEYDGYAESICAVLKEGCTEQQLLKEAKSCVGPLRLDASVVKVSENDAIGMVVAINSLVHLIGALILIASIIGFLRMQIQIFWSRRREVSLRITNGAKRMQIFWLFISEVLIVITIAVVAAMLMGNWLENFMYTHFSAFLAEGGLSIHYLSQYSFYTGLLLLVVCALVIWFSLNKICKSIGGLAANMRGSRSHSFRNVMLWVQIAISTFFVCGTFCVVNWTNKMLDTYHIPEDESAYSESIILTTDIVENPQLFMREIEKLPDLDKIIEHHDVFLPCQEIETVIGEKGAQEMMDKYDIRGSYLPFYCSSDTSLLTFFNLNVHWFDSSVKEAECLIMDEKTYQKLKMIGVADNGKLTIWLPNEEGNRTIPIVGTINGIPYSTNPTSILIHPSTKDFCRRYALVPKDGKQIPLMHDVNATLRRLEASVSTNVTCPFLESHSQVMVLRSIRTAVWILGIISMIICAMSIYSTIALDTRTRKKEVAVRKVNGAKNKDIYRLFGRIYIILVFTSLFIAIPATILLNNMLGESIPLNSGITLSPIIPCIVGVLSVIVLIAAIVVWNIRKIMEYNPIDVLTKE